MTVRGSANLLTRTTAILAALFFATAIGLTILSQLNKNTSDILDSAAAPGEATPSTVLDALSQLGGGETLPLPSTAASAEAAPAADTTSSAPAAADSTTTSDPGLALPVAPAPSEPAEASAASSAPAQ